jgi:hypothetical protein
MKGAEMEAEMHTMATNPLHIAFHCVTKRQSMRVQQARENDTLQSLTIQILDEPEAEAAVSIPP